MNTGFGSLHPLVCFVYYAGIILFSLLFVHPVYLITEIILLLALLLLHGQGRTLVRLLPFYMLTGGLIAIVNPLLSHRGWHILFYFMDQPITLEAILYGVFTMLSILSILLLFVSYQYIITTDKFMYLFSAIAPQTALHTWMTLHFIPLFIRRMKQITLIQRTRGIDMRRGGFIKRIRSAAVLLRVLLTWSLEDAMRTGDSMKARGYGTARRTAYHPYRMDARDRGLLVLWAMLLLICLGGWMHGYGQLKIYPKLESARLSPGEWVHYGLFCLFLVIPIFIEGKERYVWRSYRPNA